MHTKRTYHHFTCYFIILLTAVCALVSCSEETERVICVYNNQTGYRRAQMTEEMKYEAAQHPNVHLVFRSKQAGDDTEEEMNVLEEFIQQKPDAIIFASENAYLRSLFREAQMNGIPIILLNNTDPKATYTSRITNNNVKAGRDAALYMAKSLNGSGRVLMIKGVTASADDRSKGFLSVMDSLPGIEVVETIEGSYSRPIARDNVREFLKRTDLSKPIDAVFAQNDRMAIGAHEAFEEFEATKKWNTTFMGIDGLMCDTLGLECMMDGSINTSMLLPTGGCEAVQQAIQIIEGEPFVRDLELDAHVITRDSVLPLRKRWNEIVQRYNNATNERAHTLMREKRYSHLEALLLFSLVAVFSLFVVLIHCYVHMRAYVNKVEALNLMNNELQQKHSALQAECAILIEQRDRWFDLRTAKEAETGNSSTEEENMTFRNRLLNHIRHHMDDESFNVESLGDKMGLSRVQLNRRVKSEFKMNPGELLRNTRMDQALHLLRSTDLTIAEVAYRVGFSNAKYFSKNFKEHFQCTPSEAKRK